MILKFSTERDRQIIKNTMVHFSHRKCSNSDMERIIMWIMGKYGVKKIHIENFAIKITEGEKTQIFVIECKERFSESCPNCNESSDNAKYLRTIKENMEEGKDCITVICKKCGRVYNTDAPSDEGVIK